MSITIIHIGGTEKSVEFVGFDAPRPWIRLRYPNGAGIFSFALAHGGIECPRKGYPEWRIAEADLAELRAAAKEAKVKFSEKAYAPYRRTLPGAPKKKTENKQAELFGERGT